MRSLGIGTVAVGDGTPKASLNPEHVGESRSQGMLATRLWVLSFNFSRARTRLDKH